MSRPGLPALLQASAGFNTSGTRLPSRLHGWELTELAAEGSLARVYRGRPAGSSSPHPPSYAIKILRARWHHQPQVIDLLRRETLLGRQLKHPHVLPVLASNLSRPPYYLVTPWLEGQTLRRRLHDGPPMELPAALWVVRQTAEALSAFEQAGWMHGDVKPSNLMISPEGHVTLLDLGFARRSEETGTAAERPLVGTGSYLAPEMVTSRLAADIRSDIYSLGVVLFELLAGRLPFAGQTLSEVIVAHRQSRPPDLRRFNPALPAGVIRLVRQMLAKQPLRRPQSARELTERLVPLEVATFGQRA